jgi:hypothetical protein
MKNRMLKAALKYARAGLPVFPLFSAGPDGCSCGDAECHNPGKHPRTGHGFKDATTDRDTIRIWWTKWPTANIGIATGAASGLFVLDVDPRHDGQVSLRRLERDHGRLPKCPTVQTGGGGQHPYFRHPGGLVKSRSGIATGLDVRGDGGYVVAPPSRHASGRRYRWLGNRWPDLGSLPDIPRWLRRLMTEPVVKPSRNSQTISKGKRNATLTSLAGAMRRLGATRGAIRAALRKENTRRCVPPLDDKEVKKIAKSVSQYPPATQNISSRKSVATKLVELAESVRLLHTPEQEVFGIIRVKKHRETWRLKDPAFKRFLAARFYRETGTAPSAQALSDALGVLEGRALYEAPEKEVFTRVAWAEGAIWLDLCNPTWQAVGITADGWAIVSKPPVQFRRPRGMKSLPLPEQGSIDELKLFLNFASNDDFVLLISWLVAALNPQGPYPILVLEGEAGSAKSTTARVLRELVDPNTTPLRSEPRDVRDLMIAAQNSWCVAFDNVWHLQPWLSDALCRLATGGGFSTRELYSDDQEKLFEARRPILLNGIENVVSRGDIMDRSLIVHLPPIPEEQRRPEKKFWRHFRRIHPRILGALLSAASCALRRLRSIKPDRLPRMADFALWVTAAEPALGWSDGTLMRAYDLSRASANVLTLEASIIVGPLRRVCRTEQWRGTATLLLNALERSANPSELKQRDWPKNPQVLSGQLRRIAPNLRATGLDVYIGEKTAGSRSKRIITITRMRPKGKNKGAARPEQPAQEADGIRRFPRLKSDACDAPDAREQELENSAGVAGVGRVAPSSGAK